MSCPCGHKLCACVEPLEPGLPTRAQVFGTGLEWLLGHEIVDPVEPLEPIEPGRQRAPLYGGESITLWDRIRLGKAQ